MGRVWPTHNVTIMRTDAKAGWTLRQCALRHEFHETTVKKHAKLNNIVFPTKETHQTQWPGSAYPDSDLRRIEQEERRNKEWSDAWDSRWREIQAVKAEAATAPLYRPKDEDWKIA